MRISGRVSNGKSILLLPLFIAFFAPVSGVGQGLAETQDKAEKLIDRTSSKIIKKLHGVVPDDLQERVRKQLSIQLSGENRQKILEKLEKKIPGDIRKRLPKNFLQSLSGIKMTAFEHLSYLPGASDPAHQFNIYLPPVKGKKFPLIIYIHGGGWQSRPSEAPKWISTFVERGYAVACVNYRLSSEAVFPAQIEDLNTALRFLKQNAAAFNLDTERIGLFGLSAGGHLAALMGTSWNNESLNIGGDKNISRKVEAVCDWYGPTDLYSLGSKTFQGNAWDLKSAGAPLSLLLGEQAQNNKAKADAASPITYVSKDDPAVLIMHGDMDNIIPVEQSREFADALKSAGADVSYRELKGKGHGFQNREYLQETADFFDKHLNPKY